jgi:hypothetical protein
METMGFGKHKGLPMSQVPLSYLLWCHEIIPDLPPAVVGELERRGIATAAGLINKNQQAVAAEKIKRSAEINKRGERRRQNKERTVRAVVARIQQSEMLGREPSKSEVRFFNRNGGERMVTFKKLRADFIRAGGDLSACPFATATATATCTRPDPAD